ncbi:MAG: polymer-forming cytoskeletal protein [Burkholderiaceae bacterium]|jgi:cytoskeletal protein CcmA (bactofilin family)|nr:polymer-forming cytoskeletal protein [Burkholderiaceae bacterium]
MFGSRRATPKTIGTLIGAGTRIEGTLAYTGGLRIDGTVEGDVRSLNGEPGMVIISEQGSVIGEVHAAHLVVSGKVTGPIYVSDVVELQPKARVEGDVHYRAVEIHHGAVVEGRLIHDVAETRPALKLATAGATSE